MNCKIESLEMMGDIVGKLMKYAMKSLQMNEETRYYLKVVISELILNSFLYGDDVQKEVKISVAIKGERVMITVNNGSRGTPPSPAGRHADSSNEYNWGLAIVKGLCQFVERNPEGNRVRACLSLHSA